MPDSPINSLTTALPEDLNILGSVSNPFLAWLFPTISGDSTNPPAPTMPGSQLFRIILWVVGIAFVLWFLRPFFK